ncbi:hypothetical protein F3Y22_tig00112503pilonHSYRG00249 [Hibiscus syriacus]|uniref:ABC transporter domain-containing protein n=1 Tax=Hibiscus syriacus TaxID=106335 RepID=A0A6A2WWT7_HIBSY|nr:hypothetical protein F3Y22_tig00112503pilonHSYRG00249 [Hibiscus syriacus]
MENAGKMEKQRDEKADGKYIDREELKPTSNKMAETNDMLKDENAANKRNGRKATLVKQKKGKQVLSAGMFSSKCFKSYKSGLYVFIYALLGFSQTNPTGRVINRFSRDLGDIDSNVANSMDVFMTRSTSREVKRLDSITRSPVYAQVGEAFNGFSSIRAYRAYDRIASVIGRPELPPVLYGLSFTVAPSERVGIVGRTGAGKSSMLNALFRIVELEKEES